MNGLQVLNKLKRKVSRVIYFLKYLNTDKKFRRFLQGRTIYFTVQPAKVGFTDQLIRFTTILKLGKFMGLRYFHIPFQPKPLIIEPEQEFTNSVQNDNPDIYDFIGINAHFNSTNPDIAVNDLETITVILDKAEIEKNKIGYFDQLICFLEMTILQKFGKSLKKTFLIHYKITSPISDFSWISAPISKKTLDFDFNEIYLKYRKTNPHQPKFDNNKIKLLLHSRQGDTAVIKTPWNTFIQVWSRKVNSFIEFNQIHEINDVSIVTVDDFYSFYKNLKKAFGEEKLSSLLFSDGFARSFFKLFAKTGKLNFTEQQVEQLQKWALTYNREAFKKFEDLAELNMFIGEESEKIFDLIHSFLYSDVVIFGTQQRMIPKLYSFYFRNNEGPICIVLYRQKLVNYDNLSNSQMSKNFVFVDLDNYVPSEIHGRIINFLKERKKNLV
jgi:hypothetical protein